MAAPLPADYAERVYAGVLGKIIGVYLGRPFEGWPHDTILEKLGEIGYYVHQRLNQPLVVTDDDISGTFTFLRALPDYGNDPNLTPEQIGQTWLNYIVEGKTILWWGGMGHSTEHTAYLRLKHGVPAPRSGSLALNGQTVAEQIGAQIFIDGWGMICPSDPERAADFARRAASVSHDGEAIYAAQVVAAMEAQAFVEPDIDRLLDTGLSVIPRDCLVARLIADLRAWHAQGLDWKAGYREIENRYGYGCYGGGCHVIPNHALIVHALLHGGGDFSRSLMIVNTCGWDTDCNSANVGCLLGIRNGLAGIDDGPDWRGPVRDRLYLPTADGGRCITDAATEALHVVNIGRALQGLEPHAPKDGARFHFTFPGSVQGFSCGTDPDCAEVATVEQDPDRPALAIRYRHLSTGRVARIGTPTFIPPDARQMPGYGLLACPTLSPGQTIRAEVVADESNLTAVTASLFIAHYTDRDDLRTLGGDSALLEPGDRAHLQWTLPDLGGGPTVEVGLKLLSEARADGVVYLDSLTWSGVPDVVLSRPGNSDMWRRSWVSSVDEWTPWGAPFHLIQNEGTGLAIYGAREWKDLRVTSAVTPHLAESCGVALRVQGLRRYYALLLCRDGRLRLVKALDGERILAEHPFPWEFGECRELALEVVGSRLTAYLDGNLVFDHTDDDRPLTEGAIGLILTEGRLTTDAVAITPAT